MRKLCAIGCAIHKFMSVQRIVWITIVVGILLAVELGFFLFLGETTIAIFLGVPQIVVVGGILWLAHGLLAEAKS